ncbi:DUF805 domain-containing protein [Brachybacterium endophyticum]|uniref:DUF805 domain-containing protein n=1 Tax=Brachybacterium endophyticum TaxID=2182385 RepID=A0A2U2RNE0_9MICO|nr:DUF805 domain-containing protein [Brachybacterium endophyticum]PWH07294.1 DUF805 domain-containing protein [Brachybacterium endophyticum]
MLRTPSPVRRAPSLPPLPGATPVQALRRFVRQYAVFAGRASRSEYWWWVLINLIVTAVLDVAGRLTTGDWSWNSSVLVVARWPEGGAGTPVGILATVYSVAVILPSLAVLWRRLHDADHSGLWAFLLLIPFVGWILLAGMLASRSDPDGARFDRPTERTGPDAPLGFRSGAWTWSSSAPERERTRTGA